MGAKLPPGAALAASPPPGAGWTTDLHGQPGHLIRRAHQIAVAAFADAADGRTTPLQYALLCGLQAHPGVDQVTLARIVALDNSTTAETAARLEAKGLIVRELMARRQRRLSLTPAGRALLDELVPAVHRIRGVMLRALDDGEQHELMRLLRKMAAHEDGGAAPV